MLQIWRWRMWSRASAQRTQMLGWSASLLQQYSGALCPTMGSWDLLMQSQGVPATWPSPSTPQGTCTTWRIQHSRLMLQRWVVLLHLTRWCSAILTLAGGPHYILSCYSADLSSSCTPCKHTHLRCLNITLSMEFKGRLSAACCVGHSYAVALPGPKA